MAVEGGINSRWNDPGAYDGELPPDWDARRKRVYRHDDWTCTQCGRKSGPHSNGDGVRLHAHHMVPRSEGGSNQLSNLTTLCKSCHNAAHEHDITASADWVGDTAETPGVVGRLKQALVFIVGTGVAWIAYLFSVLTLLGYIESPNAPIEEIPSLSPTATLAASAVVLLVIVGISLWKPIYVAVGSTLATGYLAAIVTFILSQGFTPVLIFIGGITLAPGALALAVYARKRVS